MCDQSLTCYVLHITGMFIMLGNSYQVYRVIHRHIC